ncbi:cytochrome c oxidase subunit II [Glaciimonas immobilis]|uniref:cytochrome-c oxidase n=1 Tax=Glaciimonas immobilis TaxID=728004 RepID=A0A840RKQ9_9BURK|nr:c-type cytochrome [Glaciimonas immobilis]KAF3998953.1 cytochrome c oxidase subunit II [Glaciimonas immobilis]MBB5198363.1 cytochrome c oxidase subunit 2 [Glaciimonas immobilis]
MTMAVVLIIIVDLSVLFHIFSPWRATPLASNWQQMDSTLTITFIITGFVFVVLNLFLVYMLLRFGHRKGHRAVYHPENKKLEWWLTGVTTVGIIALLAPGLVVYANFVDVPKNALKVEVLGQQWQWRFRFPGASGRLGRSSVSLVSPTNPFGIDPGDRAGQDNILINSNELHLPVNAPVQMMLRSQDVLHDFYVPPFRARMNMVPGMVTSFWFTPNKVGRYEVLCAQLCGVGHANMRGLVVVEDAASFQKWLATQPTFATSLLPPKISAGGANAGASGLVAQGKSLATSKACLSCHTVDGGALVGPTWKGLFGRTETMEDGSTAFVDEAYLRDFIRNPTAHRVKGFTPIMPRIDMTDDELSALVAYIKSIGADKKQNVATSGSPIGSNEHGVETR